MEKGSGLSLGLSQTRFLVGSQLKKIPSDDTPTHFYEIQPFSKSIYVSIILSEL